MALGKYDSRHHTQLCPIPTCGARIFMDRGSYAAHMVASHSATDTAFPDEGIRGKNQYDRTLAKDGVGAPVIFAEEEPLIRCGCESTSDNLESLFGHLNTDHGVTVP